MVDSTSSVYSSQYRRRGKYKEGTWDCVQPHSNRQKALMMVLLICRPDEFVDCDAPVDHVGNATASQELGYGCLKVRFLFCCTGTFMGSTTGCCYRRA